MTMDSTHVFMIFNILIESKDSTFHLGFKYRNVNSIVFPSYQTLLKLFAKKLGFFQIE